MFWDEPPTFVAPRDEQEGGTWLGVNRHGVLVALTNRFGSSRDARRRSRGALVVDALRGTDATEASFFASRHAPDAHNPYHLLTADEASAVAVWSDGEATTAFALAPGIHVVTERSFGAAPNGRAEFIERCVAELQDTGALTRDALKRLLAIHRPDDFDATSVLVPELNYGTRSSTIIDVAGGTLDFADGPPTEASYLDYSDLLRQMWAS